MKLLPHARAPRTTTRSELALSMPERRLTLCFAEPHRTASWAVVGGGLRSAGAVAFLQVLDHELRPPVDAVAYARARLRAADLHGAVALLTSRRLDRYADVSAHRGALRARCIATVGLGNALRAGDPPGAAGRIGTINLCCQINTALTEEALLEALALAAEARTLAVREAAIASRRSGLPASGTGTDCIVIAAPIRPRALRYAGMHTSLGHVIGRAVLQATAQGIASWRRDQTDTAGRDQEPGHA